MFIKVTTKISEGKEATVLINMDYVYRIDVRPNSSLGCKCILWYSKNISRAGCNLEILEDLDELYDMLTEDKVEFNR